MGARRDVSDQEDRVLTAVFLRCEELRARKYLAFEPTNRQLAKKIRSQPPHRDQLAKKRMPVRQGAMASARLDVYAALLAARSEREILLPLRPAIPSRVRGFASHLRFIGAADTGSPPTNLACDNTQVLMSHCNQN